MIKQKLKLILFKIPVLNYWLVRQRNRSKLSGTNESLVSFLMHTSHGVDHLISRNEKPYKRTMLTLKAIINEVKKRNIEMTEDIYWALQIYAIAKYGLVNLYSKSLEIGSQANQVEFTDDNPVAKSVKSRRSIRVWDLERKIKKDVLLALIDTAKWAPSSCNRQTWKILLLENDDDKKWLADFYTSHNKFWSNAPIVLVVTVDSDSYARPEQHYAYLDGGAFIQNLLLLIHSVGLGACWVGFSLWNSFEANNAIANKRDFYSRFDIPENYIPISIVPIGYPGINPKITKRKPTEQVLFRA